MEKSKAVVRFRRKGFHDVDKPTDTLPKMPTSLSDVSSDKLGNITSKYAAWREYTEDLHLGAAADFMRLKLDYDYELSKTMIIQKGSTVKDKKMNAECSQEVHALRLKLLDAEIYLDMLANKLESFNNALAVLSREISRRGTINV